jgi:Protein similar to CwfJ C-terminus 2
LHLSSCPCVYLAFLPIASILRLLLVLRVLGTARAAGFVHVIDDEGKWDPDFGRSIMVGLLGLPERGPLKRAKAESVSTQQQWVAQMIKQFEPYDWTKALA